MIRVTAMKSPSGGFSLLELLVVLVIMGGITGLAMPNLVQLYKSFRLSVDRDSILDQLRNMGRIALRNQQSYLLDDSLNYPESDQRKVSMNFDYLPYSLAMPPDWRIELNEPIIVRANGVCMGGIVTLLYEGDVQFQAELKPPYCHVDK